MARFGQAFINSLTNPSYGQGLFTAAQQFGAAPAVAREKQQRSKAMEIVNQALASNNPEQLLQAAEAIKGFDPESAIKLSQAAGQIRQQGIASLEQGAEEIQQRASEARQQLNLKNRRDRLETNAVALAKRMNPDNPAVAQGLIGADEETLREYLMTGGKTKEGSKAKGNKTEKEILEKGKLVSYIITTDPYTGEELGRVKVGEVKTDEEEAETFGGRADWKGPDKEAFLNARDEARTASLNSVKYADLLNETLSMVDEGGQVGGILGFARDFVINDIAGLGDAISIHRARLNEVRMKNAIELLPKGPASDIDVALAFDASVDPKNLSPENRIRYIRGMKKLADAEAQYTQGKIEYIENTGDALAFGYDRYVQLKGAENRLESFKTDNAPVVAAVEEDLNKVRSLISQGKEEEAKALLEVIKQSDTTGYLDKVENLQRLRNSWQSFAEENNISL